MQVLYDYNLENVLAVEHFLRYPSTSTMIVMTKISDKQ